MEYEKLATEEMILSSIEELKKRRVEATVVDSGKDALEKIKQLVPDQSSVMNGSSTTLKQIGFIDYLKSGNHPWKNLHEEILKEKDPKKQALLRKNSVISDYYLGSVHALSQTGEFIIASNSGSQLPHIVFTSENLIFVVGTQKIVQNLKAGFRRLEEYVIPLENERMMQEYGVGTNPNKIVIFKGEKQGSERKVRMILVKEKLGF